MTRKPSDKKFPDISANTSRRLFTDLIIGLLSIVIIVASLSMGGYFFIAYRKASQTLEGDADQYISYLIKSLELPLWSLDDETVQQIGDAYMTSGRVSLLEIISNAYEEEYIYVKKKDDENDMVLRKAQIFHSGQIVGSIRIGLSRAYYEGELYRFLISSIGILLIIVLAMMVATSLMLHYFVRKPLQLLMDVAEDMSQGNYERKQEKIRHYEISIVYGQLVIMAENVKRRETSLAESNTRLRGEIARRENSEREILRLRNYLFNIINSMPSCLVAVDIKGRVTQWNNQMEQATGISFKDALSRPLAQVFPRLAEKMPEIETAIRESRVVLAPKVSRQTKQGTCFENITIFPLIANKVEGAVIRIDDVTEHVRMEEMMVQSEKMLTVGGLAAGMAHEINNPLAGILQTTGVMSNRLSTNLKISANRKAAEEAGITLEAIEQFMKSRGIFRMIDTINSSCRRVTEVVKNMLSFARKSDEGMIPYSMDEIMDSALDLAATDYDLKKEYDFKKITIIKEYTDSLPPIPCQKSQIQQVLLNILGNGAQAMKSAGTENPHFIIRAYVEKHKDMICLEIEDNGPGMDEVIRKKIFDPFYTTKPPGMGTGLGLSVSYFIITENHQGKITVESEPGAGAKFIISLPLYRRRQQ
ncbi:ATP-binding protein [Desulfogranum japonicum]|uniref:ATP-binding protein n=1 Tax=Desulfogranum japonicum TaxID=231447 RepID=UPI000687F88F|nr:ATP-binding protein [Desulfogranum japonicum]